MKKYQDQPWKNLLDVSVSLDHFNFTRDLVEKMAYRPFSETEHIDLPDGEMLELSAIEAYMKGSFHLSIGDGAIKMPFISSFFFTCTRLAGDQNRLTWTHSLS